MWFHVELNSPTERQTQQITTRHRPDERNLPTNLFIKKGKISYPGLGPEIKKQEDRFRPPPSGQ